VHWAEPDYGLSAGQHAVLPEGKGKGKGPEQFLVCWSNKSPVQCTTVFGHIARLADNVPAHLALRCQMYASLGGLPSHNWKSRHIHPRNRWLNSNCSPVDLWRKEIRCAPGASSSSSSSSTNFIATSLKENFRAAVCHVFH